MRLLLGGEVRLGVLCRRVLLSVLLVAHVGLLV
jgi:hypothetical protein